VFRAEEIEVRADERRLLARGVPVALGGRAFDLLLVLIEHRDRVVGKDELLATVWPGVVVEENNLTVQVSSLRKALGAHAIATVAGRGYRFTLPLLDDAAAEPAAPRERPVIAVLAFDNQSSEPEMQFFSDGISEEIIQRLARGTQLRVISRTTSLQLRGERKAEAAERLACSHVLDGSVRRAAGQVRISAHLMEAASGTTLWSDRYDRTLEGVFEVQDEIAESIARALDHAFFGASTRPVEPAVYDLYLRSHPRSYAPDELRTSVGVLEVVTQRAPHFIEAWARLAYLRSFLHLYLPFAQRQASAAQVVVESSQALAQDPQSNDALVARCFVVPPFGRFIEAEDFLERLRQAPGASEGRRYISWLLRLTGRLRASLEEAERIYRLDALDPMSANLVALARMATGHVAEAVPVYEDLVARIPEMSFPISSLLRAHAFLGDWAAVDRLLALAATRPLREFQDTIPFVRAKRDPSSDNLAAYRSEFEAHVAITGGVDVARLVYAAHLGLLDEAYRAADQARLGPAGASTDIMGPDGYRTALLFQAGMPELRNDPRFVRLCTRLGLVEFWRSTGRWPDCADEVPYDLRRACEQVRDVPKDDFGF
jgi:TolB-like protein/tetratricopeptide (TPR) repeat protein